MGATLTHTYRPHGADPVLGIRIGADACRRANEQGHRPRGAIMRYARELALYATERNRLADGSVRHARRSASVKDPSRVKPRVTLENVLAAERRFKHEPKRGADVTIAGAIMVAVATGDEDGVRSDLEAAVRDASPEAERIRHAQERKQAQQRARKLTAKQGR